MTITAVPGRVNTFQVVGSQGQPYTVNTRCDCKGFQYRGQCRHMVAVNEYKATHREQVIQDLESRIAELF